MQKWGHSEEQILRAPRQTEGSAKVAEICQVLFTPLLAAFSVWFGVAISTRSRDVRVAQLSLLGSLPVGVATSLIAFDVIHATLGLAIGLALLLLLANALGWRIVAPMFDRERLLTGTT